LVHSVGSYGRAIAWWLPPLMVSSTSFVSAGKSTISAAAGTPYKYTKNDNKNYQTQLDKDVVESPRITPHIDFFDL